MVTPPASDALITLPVVHRVAGDVGGIIRDGVLVPDREAPPAWCRGCGAQRHPTKIRERDCDLCRVYGPGAP